MAKKELEVRKSWNVPSREKEATLPYLNKMYVEIEWIENALATLPNSKKILEDYIASNAPTEEAMNEEIENTVENGSIPKSTNVYPKGSFLYDAKKDRFFDTVSEDMVKRIDPTAHAELKDNVRFYYDYQIRGAFKDSCGLLAKAKETGDDGKKTASTESSALKAYKKVIDGGIFVFPRRIGINIPDTYIADDRKTICNTFDSNGNLTVFSRPMRVNTPTGERPAIASSELIPAGSRIKFTIGYTSPDYKSVIYEWLDYLCIHGISGWRNSGMGICRWREIKSDYTPYDDED